MSGYEFRFAKGWARIRSAAIAGSFVLASAQAAFAGSNDNLNFREFRAQNPTIDRHVARKMFQDENRQQRLQDAGRLRIQPIINSSVVQTSQTTSSTVNTPRPHINLNRVHQNRNRSVQLSDTGRIVHLRSGLDLDLSSNDRNISLGQSLFADGTTVSINVGGESKTVGAGSLVSAAEYVAVKQALGGGQTVTIDRSGRATGGDVDLESIATDRTAFRASELVIPANVTTSGDFSRNSDFKLLGNLNNYGTVHALSSDGSPRSGSIRAVDINNFKGATISSDISSLTLDASGDLNNFGTIQSTGALTLAAAGTINNSGTTRATNDVNLQSANINNQGRIESTAGNINVEGSSSAVLNVDNSGGTLKALNGSINFRNAAYNGSFDSYVQGGDLRSQDVNIYAGQATANVYVGDLTGVLNQYGLATHVSASTDTLNLGAVCLTGDPTIYNTAGDINISANILTGENLVLVASQNITSANGVSIQAASITQGFEINFIAGAAFTPSGGNSTPDIPPLNGAGGVTLSGKSSRTGGSILLGTGVTVSTQALPTPNSDGNGVLMVAFGKKGTAGKIDVSGTTIKTGGTGTGKNGDVYLLAESTKGDVIKTGVVDTTGGSDFSTFGQNGSAGFYTVDIISSDGNPVVYNAQGQVTSGNFLTGNNLNKTGNIVVTDTAAPIDINVNQLSIDGGTVTQNAQVEAKGSAEIVATTTITDGPGASYKSGINVFLIGKDIGTAANPITLDTDEVSSFGPKGKLNFVEIIGPGFVQVGGNTKGTLSFSAPDRLLSTLGFNPLLNGKDVILNADAFGTMKAINGSASVSISADTGSIRNTNFSQAVFTPKLTLSTNFGDIGTSISPFNIPVGDKTLSMTAKLGSIYLNSISGNEITFTELEASSGEIVITAQSSVTLADPLLNTNKLSITIPRDTLSVSGQLEVFSGISLVNTDANGKITFAKNTSLHTGSPVNGDIKVSVGPNSATPVPPPIPNIQQNDTGPGQITITGAGLYGKSPTNTLTVPGPSNIIINNGSTKAKNISLNGNVSLKTDN